MIKKSILILALFFVFWQTTQAGRYFGAFGTSTEVDDTCRICFPTFDTLGHSADALGDSVYFLRFTRSTLVDSTWTGTKLRNYFYCITKKAYDGTNLGEYAVVFYWRPCAGKWYNDDGYYTVYAVEEGIDSITTAIKDVNKGNFKADVSGLLAKSDTSSTGASYLRTKYVEDKTGYSLTQTFPTNFSSLIISSGGGTYTDSLKDSILTSKKILSNAITSTGIAADAIGASELGTDCIGVDEASQAYWIEGSFLIADYVWDEGMSGHTTDATFGGDFLDADTWTNTKAGYLDAAVSTRLAKDDTSGAVNYLRTKTVEDKTGYVLALNGLDSDTSFARIQVLIDTTISSRLAPTVQGRDLYISSANKAGIDFDQSGGTLAPEQLESNILTKTKIDTSFARVISDSVWYKSFAQAFPAGSMGDSLNNYRINTVLGNVQGSVGSVVGQDWNQWDNAKSDTASGMGDWFADYFHDLDDDSSGGGGSCAFGDTLYQLLVTVDSIIHSTGYDPDSSLLAFLRYVRNNQADYKADVSGLLAKAVFDDSIKLKATYGQASTIQAKTNKLTFNAQDSLIIDYSNIPYWAQPDSFTIDISSAWGLRSGLSTFNSSSDSVIVDKSALGEVGVVSSDSLAYVTTVGSINAVDSVRKVYLVDSLDQTIIATVTSIDSVRKVALVDTTNYVKDGNLSCTGSGSNTVIIWIKNNADSTGIANFRIDVEDSITGAVIGMPRWTNISGVCTLALDDGHYTLYLSASRWIIASPVYKTVTGNVTLTYYATSFTPGPPPSVEYCVVYGWVDTAGVLIEGANVVAEIPYYPLKYGDLLLNPYIRHTTTDSAGYWDLDLYINSLLTPNNTRYQIWIYIPQGNLFYSDSVLIPNQSSWEFPY